MDNRMTRRIPKCTARYQTKLRQKPIGDLEEESNYGEEYAVNCTRELKQFVNQKGKLAP